MEPPFPKKYWKGLRDVKLLNLLGSCKRESCCTEVGCFTSKPPVKINTEIQQYFILRKMHVQGFRRCYVIFVENGMDLTFK